VRRRRALLQALLFMHPAALGQHLVHALVEFF